MTNALVLSHHLPDFVQPRIALGEARHHDYEKHRQGRILSARYSQAQHMDRLKTLVERRKDRRGKLG
jgi:hypothetical protein